MSRPHAQPALPMEIPPTDIWLRERAARIHGHMLVAGVDEAGRGPLAGPVVAAAVLLPMGVAIAGINDSKLLTAEQREDLAVKIRTVAIAIGVAEASHEEVDDLNIAVAGRLALQRAVEALPLEPDYLLIDGFPVPECKLPQEALIKGDRRSASIMAGGIIAKTTRDAAMRLAAKTYPGYGFEEHFGYSTPRHARALKDLGPCAIHRRSFRPVTVAEALLAGEPVEVVAPDVEIFGRETTT
ncbi:MAG: ribonuclease HII [Candidatus Dormibacteraeota bacterium]|nr:ribonuclease HII [Candidatus Dormibacteraeota bacterium]